MASVAKKLGAKHFLASALDFFSPSWGPHLLFLSKSACLSFYLYLSSFGFSLFPYVEEFKVSNRAFFSFVPINVLCFSAILNFLCHCNWSFFPSYSIVPFKSFSLFLSFLVFSLFLSLSLSHPFLRLIPFLFLLLLFSRMKSNPTLFCERPKIWPFVRFNQSTTFCFLAAFRIDGRWTTTPTTTITTTTTSSVVNLFCFDWFWQRCIGPLDLGKPLPLLTSFSFLCLKHTFVIASKFCCLNFFLLQHNTREMFDNGAQSEGGKVSV